jgi:hypothetical protein
MRPILLGPPCAIGLSLATVACSPPPAAPSRRDPPFQATASIRELMETEIDPSADFLWASVASVSSEAGFEDRQPRTDEEWTEVRRKALILIEATNLLVIPGRRVAVNYVAARSAGELDSTESQKRVDASRDAFDAMAHVLRDAGLEALRAIDRRSPADLLEAGGVIDAACEACHVTYWYPDQAIRGQASR